MALIKVKFVVYKLQHYMHGCHTDLGHSAEPVRPRTHGNDFLRFCIVSSNELVVLNSLENNKQYKNAGKRFRVYGAL